MDNREEGVVVGYGFDGPEKGPYLLLDDMSKQKTVRDKFYVRDKKVPLRILPETVCTGIFNLRELESYPCPKRAKIKGDKKNMFQQHE